MSIRLLTPVGGNLALWFFIAAVPIVTVQVMFGVLRRHAYQASAPVSSSPWRLPS